MPNSDLPEDSALRRHAETAGANLRPSAIDPAPTDSVLRRHYEQLHGAAAASPVPRTGHTAVSGSGGSGPAFQDDVKSASNAPICKRLLWLALLALVGVIALYQWYTAQLKGSITERETQVSESMQKLSAADQKLGLMAQNEQSLRADMEAAAARHQQEVDRLNSELDGARQANEGLKNDMEALRQAHADTLAAEQQKAADRYAQLQGQYDNANQQIVNLNGDIEQLKQDMTAAATRHQMQIQETNARMGERVDYFRTALEGSEPERAQQLIALDEKIMSLSRDLDAARETIASLEASNTDLGQQLANAENALEQNEQALAQAGRDMAAIQAQLSQRQNLLVDLQAQYDAAKTEAAQALAAAQEELRLANEAHSAASAEASMLLENTKSAAAEAAAKAAVVLEQTKTAAAAAMQQASAEHAAEMTEAKGRIAALDQELQQEKSALAALQDKYDTTVADLNAKLADTERTLADTDAKLAASISAAAAAKLALEGEIAAKETRIAKLEQTVADERQQAAQQLLTAQEQHRNALAYQKNLYTDLAALGGTQTEQGMLLRLADTELRFRIGGSKLPKGELPNLDRIAEFLQKYSKLSARVEGHTDNTGREETNMELSLQRANAVMEALVERGVAAERLTAEGIGMNRPIATNDTPAGRRKNRRVEIYVNEG